MIFLQDFANFMKMYSPPRWGAHFRRTIFANIVCKTMFPYPNWLQNHHFWGGISALCCAKNNMFRRLSGKWPTLEALFNITCVLACIFKQIFMFSALILPLFLGSSVDRHFYPRLHSGSNFHISALDFATAFGKLCLISFASRMHF